MVAQGLPSNKIGPQVDTQASSSVAPPSAYDVALPPPIDMPLQSTPQEISTSAAQIPPQENKPAQSSAEPVSPPAPKRGFPKIIVFLGVLLLLVLVAYLLVNYVFNKKETSQGAELVWWGLWENSAAIAPLIEEYQQKNPDVKITYVGQAQQDYRERLTNAIASGKGPDIFRYHNSWVPMFRSELDALPPAVMSAGEFAQAFYPIAAKDLVSGTSIVGIPLEYDGLALYINEQIFEDSVKTPPKTWNDLRETAIELTIKDEAGVIQQAGVALGTTTNVDHWPEILALMMLQNGVNLSKPQLELTEDALRFYSIFSKTDKVWDETQPPSTLAFANGKLAMYIAPSWRAFEIKDRNPGLRFRTYPVPQLPKASPDEADITYATYWAEGVWARSKNKEAAWKFLKFLAEKDSLEKFYQVASGIRFFGEPYPRVEMAGLLLSHPILGSIITQAPGAQSWYLASRTFDGPTGINSQLEDYFEDALNSLNENIRADKVLETLTAGIDQVLIQYGLTK